MALETERANNNLVPEEAELIIDFPELDRIGKPSSKCIRLQDKLVFLLGVANVILLAYFAGAIPWIMPYFFTVKFPLLMLHRLVTFCRSNDQLYLIDFCVSESC